MKYLLDSGVWVWSIDAVERIGRAGREILQSGQEEIYFSAASVWELTIKASIGKLKLPSEPGQCIPAFAAKQGLRPLPITQVHAVRVYSLPLHHHDPFDRLLIAQALEEEMAILTADPVFKKYPVDLVWCGT